MSTQFYTSEKTQYIQCDSGFVSCASSDCQSCSMKIAHATPQTNSDYVKDLQEDFADINNFDAVSPMQTESCNVSAKFNVNWNDQPQQQQQQQEEQDKQILRYFEQDEDGDTQLHYTFYNPGYTNVAIYLIDNAPYASLLDIRNNSCLTALHLAAYSKQYDIVRRLVLVGADTRIVTTSHYMPWTSRGNAAIHMACEANDCQCVQALTEPLSEKEQAWLAYYQRIPPVLGQDLEIRNFNGITPMHLAITKGNLEIVKQLVKVGAKVNTVDPCSGFTSLHIAIRHKHRHIVEYMAKQHSSCINVPTRFGMYAYEIALGVDKQLAEDLVAWGAQPIVRESDSDSDSYSESDSDDEPQDYSPSYSDMYQTGSVATATLIIT